MRQHKLPLIINLLVGENDLSLNDKIELWEKIRHTHINISHTSNVKYDIDGEPMPVMEEDTQETIDLEYDAKYIYASFRQIGINLFNEQNKMHWEEFQALLESLPEDTIIQKIVQIRLWQPQKGDTAKYKMKMKKLQEKYRLPGGEVDE